MSRPRSLGEVFALFTRNPISLLGTGLTTAAAILFMSLWVMSALGFQGGGAYLGLITFVAVPMLFLFGLLLIPLGLWLEKRRLAKGGAARTTAFPVLDFNVSRTRNIVLSVAVATVINVVLLSAATYKSVEVMESVEFCGTACHSVMEPEHTTYLRSPHSRVKCVECHIGPGADWFVKSKISGSWQLVSVAFNLYPRPIQTPVHSLRPARETCEQCHWPTKFIGDRLKVTTHFKDDEKNTPTKTVLLMRVGGGKPGEAHGVHWHVDPKVEVRYRSDASRMNVYEIEWVKPDGSKSTFKTAKADSPEAKAATEWRTMDCIDCHNRPSHIYRLPEPELDQALAEGRIDTSLPFIKREGLKALQAEYPSHEAATAGIGVAIRKFYATTSADKTKVDKAASELAGIWTGNVFPKMNVKWGQYPNHLGHADEKGCFRCHEGTKISQDCNTCHSLVAMDEADPKVLKDLGVQP
jgi:nitrate/TMAO reductase-like tetraheme cytochrome c subunit